MILSVDIYVAVNNNSYAYIYVCRDRVVYNSISDNVNDQVILDIENTELYGIIKSLQKLDGISHRVNIYTTNEAIITKVNKLSMIVKDGTTLYSNLWVDLHMMMKLHQVNFHYIDADNAYINEALRQATMIETRKNNLN